MISGLVGAALWIVQIVNAVRDYSLNRFGMLPRHVDGLWGIVTQPFLHDSYARTLRDSVILIAVCWVVMLSGARNWAIVSTIVLVVGEGLTWLIAPSKMILGSSVLIFGWLGYLIARAVFSRKIRWIAVAVAVLFFFGTLLANLFPNVDEDTPWQAHLAGLAAGVLAGAVLHAGSSARPPRRTQRPAVS